MFCSAAISSYEPNVRASICRTIEIVGGRVSLEYMTSKDTHLIVPRASGKKYRNAARFGVIPVTADWLVASVAAGKVLPPDEFAPLLSIGGVGCPIGDPMADGPSMQRTSQIGPTQTQLPGAAPGITSFYQAAVGGIAQQSNGIKTTQNTATQAKPSAQLAGSGAGSINNIVGASKPPTLRERANKLLAAAQRTAPSVPRQPARGFDLGSLMGPPATNNSGMSSAAAATVAALVTTTARPSAAAVAPPVPAAPVYSLPSEPSRNINNDFIPLGSSVSRPQPNTNTANPTNINRMTNAITTTREIPKEASKHVTSETQDDNGALVGLISLIDRLKEKPNALGALGGGDGCGGGIQNSQQDMPPPPSRTHDAQGITNKVNRSRNKRSRQDIDDPNIGVVPMMPTRRSSRRAPHSIAEAESEGLGMEMSQQVGYESAPVEVGELQTDGHGAAVGAALAAKERLTRAATRQRRGLANKDILDGL